ncbi:hypothetical protein L1987_62666 [Smallanthus sonchifolius]|uniref:Uncharacterized protein n=1 Tax=Smallanthus sonchifolius TaxID=185202 RepID=A0ACB9CB98_9ASTR|nr:hypothetical protein L1987_62666 [Smallanthus sonchifolius]
MTFSCADLAFDVGPHSGFKRGCSRLHLEVWLSPEKRPSLSSTFCTTPVLVVFSDYFDTATQNCKFWLQNFTWFSISALYTCMLLLHLVFSDYFERPYKLQILVIELHMV